jgi:hypothetical protein
VFLISVYYLFYISFYVFGPMHLFLFLSHKQCILSRLYTAALLWLPKKPFTLAELNPGLLFLRRMRCTYLHPCKIWSHDPQLQSTLWQAKNWPQIASFTWGTCCAGWRWWPRRAGVDFMKQSGPKFKYKTFKWTKVR